LSWVDGLYCSVVSLTTAGYGDIRLDTTGGRIFVMIYLLVGIAIDAALFDAVLRDAMARRVIPHNEEEQS